MNRGEIKHPVITINVESIDSTLSKLHHVKILDRYLEHPKNKC